MSGEELWKIYFKAKTKAVVEALPDEDQWATSEQVHQFEIAGLQAVETAVKENLLKWFSRSSEEITKELTEKRTNTQKDKKRDEQHT